MFHVMCQITGYKNPNSLDIYNDSLEVAREVAMKTIEPSIVELDRGGIGKYSTLNDRVAEVFSEHQSVKLPSDSMYLNVEPEVTVFPYNFAGITRVADNLAHLGPIHPVSYGGGGF